MIEQNIIYSVPYLLFLLFLAVMLGIELNLRKYEHTTKYVDMFVIVVFVCFFGLKGFVGHDNYFFYNAYEDYPVFQNFHGFDTFENGDLYEPGFTLMAILCKTIGMSFWQFQFLGTAIDGIILYFIFRRESPLLALSLMIYVAMGGLMLHLEQIRNAHGVVLFMWAIKYIRERRPIPYILVCLLATTFHYTSALFLVAYPILVKEWNKNVKIAVVTFSLIVFFFQIRYIDGIMSLLYKFSGDSIQTKIEHYFMSDLITSSYTFSIRHVVILISIYFFIFIPEKMGFDKIDNTLQNIFLASVITIFCFCELNALENRFSQLFIAGIAILYPQMLIKMPIKIYRQVLTVCLVCYSFLKVSTAMKPYYYSYHTCFIESNQTRDKQGKEQDKFVRLSQEGASKVRAKETVKARTVDQLKRDAK